MQKRWLVFYGTSGSISMSELTQQGESLARSVRRKLRSNMQGRRTSL